MTRTQYACRWAELVLLFVGGPTVLWMFPGVLGDGRLFPFLWLCAGACLVYLFQDRGFERSRLWVVKGIAAPRASEPPSLEGGAGGGWRAKENYQPGDADTAKADSDCAPAAFASSTVAPHPPPAPPSREGGQGVETHQAHATWQPNATWRRTRHLFEHSGWIVARWVLLGFVVVTLYGLFAGKVVFGLRVPVELFGLPRRIPGLFFTIAIFYPWVSVYPQNVIYRAFFCHRYEPLLGSGWTMIVINAALFSFGHVMFGNWLVLALTFAGGILFTRTYLRSRSLLLSVFEHALYGLLCFSIGVGIYLLYGAFS